MIDLFFFLPLIFLFIAIEAFFSGSEISFLSVNRPRLLRRARGNCPQAQAAKALLARPELLLSTTVMGTTLAINFSTTLCTLYVISKLGFGKEWVTLVVLTPVLLLFGEFIPKVLGRARADEAVLRLAKPLTLASRILFPFTRLFMLYAQIVKKILGEQGRKSFFLSREEIQAAVPATRGSDVTASERWLIARILEFGKTTVGEMLRPLIEVVAVNENQSVADALKIISESGHSKLPVYRERVDRVVGVLHGFDCLGAPDLSVPVKSIMQPAFIIPDSKPLDELLLDLKHRSMAIAVNEYGGVEGILTMEDVIEEIVGEIEDEYDVPPKLYHQVGKNSFLVNARIEIDVLREDLKIPIPPGDDYHTLAGFLLQRMQKIPRKWDTLSVDGIEYIIQSATDRSIEEVYIILQD